MPNFDFDSRNGHSRHIDSLPAGTSDHVGFLCLGSMCCSTRTPNCDIGAITIEDLKLVV